MAEVVEIPRYRDQGCEPESLKTYLQDGRSHGDKEISKQGDTEIRRYRDTELPRYGDAEIPIPSSKTRYTEVPKDHDTESRDARIQEEYPRSPQDGRKTGQEGPNMAPNLLGNGTESAMV